MATRRSHGRLGLDQSNAHAGLSCPTGPQHLDLRGLLEKFRAITVATPATTPEAQKLAGPDGKVAVLIGMSLLGKDLDIHPYFNGYYQGVSAEFGDASLGVFPVKPLTPDEYEWAKAQGNEGAVRLAEKFLERRDSHLVWTDRPSVLLQPKLS